MKIQKSDIEKILKSKGFDDFKWILPTEIVVSHWVRMKCMFGCSSYDENAACPPNVPSVKECRKFFNEYNYGIIVHIPGKMENPEDRAAWSVEKNDKLLQVEREVFLLGFRKAFITYMDECRLCEECTANRQDCLHKDDSRPSPEAFSVDVFETAKKYDLPIKVLTDYTEEMNRYAILLID